MLDDNSIIDLYFARNEMAISATQEKYGGRLRKIAECILFSSEDSDECENDTYLRAWQTIPPKEPRTWLFAYLTSIIRNLAIDRYRKKKSLEKKLEFVSLTEELNEILPGKSSPEEDMISELERVRLKNMIEEFLKSQKAEHRVLFIRRYFYHEEVEELADRFGKSESWVKTTLFRMRKKLKKNLEDW